jgi:hypothetical protein
MQLSDDHFTPEAVEEGVRLATAANAKIELDKAVNPRAGERVCIGVPHLDNPGWNFVESIIRMASYDKAHGDHLLHNSGLMNNGAFAPVWGRSMELSHARNTATSAFLASESDWMLWIDSDIGFEQDALEKLLEVADPETAPIVGGLCFIEGDFAHDFRGGLRSSLAPTLYDWTWVEPKSGMPGTYKMMARAEWQPNMATRVGATGCGLLLVHRSAFEKISFWLRDHGAPPHIWFERIPGPDGEKCGEDISFCLRAHQVGLPVMVHTGVLTTHQKTVWYGAEDYKMKPFTPPPMNARLLPPDQWPKLEINPLAAEQAARNSPMREKQVPEATETVAIIVPVAQRDNASTFMNSLAASVTTDQLMQVRVYVMADADDTATQEAWSRALSLDYDVLDSHHYLRSMGSFAEKCNRGYLVSGEPWLFLVGDDVVFHKGWLDQAMEVARTTGAQVVGTNDLGSPVVKSGKHATHMFISRDYIAKTGASWDGPGIVCHEGYRHWFVDNEIVEAAKQRRVWAPCLASHVEHLHPYYGKADRDAVYAIGEAASETDRALWAHRFARFRDGFMIEDEGD